LNKKDTFCQIINEHVTDNLQRTMWVKILYMSVYCYCSYGLPSICSCKSGWDIENV